MLEIEIEKIRPPMVSIITPNYNGDKYISATISSVLDQTYENWEMIIVDDCSTDNSISAIDYYSDKRIKLVKLEENGGTVKARNVGINLASGTFIAFLDSDDKWTPNKLERQLEFMKHTGAPFSFTSYTIINSFDNVLGVLDVPLKTTYIDLLKKCDIGCSSVMYNTSILGKQFFDIRSPKAREDYVLWLKIAKEFEMVGITEPLMLYRKHIEGISANKSKAGLNIWRVYRDIEKLSFLKSLFYIAQYTIYGVKKHYFDNKTR